MYNPLDNGLNRRNATSQIHGFVKKFSARPQIHILTAKIVPIWVRTLKPNQKPLSISGRSTRATRRKSHFATVSADASAVKARMRSQNERALLCVGSDIARSVVATCLLTRRRGTLLVILS